MPRWETSHVRLAYEPVDPREINDQLADIARILYRSLRQTDSAKENTSFSSRPGLQQT